MPDPPADPPAAAGGEEVAPPAEGGATDDGEKPEDAYPFIDVGGAGAGPAIAVTAGWAADGDVETVVVNHTGHVAAEMTQNMMDVAIMWYTEVVTAAQRAAQAEGAGTEAEAGDGGGAGGA
jgi:hypothetical protein